MHSPCVRMLEIIAREGELKNASQKIYKFCLEKGESIPTYTIGNSTTHRGFTYTAQCVALGHVGIGMLFSHLLYIRLKKIILRGVYNVVYFTTPSCLIIKGIIKSFFEILSRTELVRYYFV